MKKFYLSAAAVLLLAGTSVAQMNYPAKLERHIATDDDSEINNLPSSPAEKALGVTFWTNDFSTPADWTADNDGQSAPFGWNIGTTVNSWWGAFSGGINSTSGGNFAEIYNGDYNQGDQAIGVVYTLTTSSPIDVLTLAGTDQVTLSFEQFGALFNDGQKVYVSTDGLSWTEVFTNNDRTVFVGNNPSAVYSNPETVTANIANAISAANGGNPSTVWIRFEWTTRITGNMTPNAWTTFGWFIDDVALTTNADNEIEAQASWWGSNGLPYYQIPTTQIAPIDFSGIAFNGGIATQNNVQLNVDINSGAFTGSSAGVGIDPGQDDSLGLTTPYTPAATPGSHNVVWGFTQTEMDDIPANNDLGAFSFDVTDYIYARDAGTPDGSTWNGGDGFEAGPLYEMFGNANIHSVDVTIATSANPGASIYVKLYSIDAGTGDFIQEDQSDYYVIQNGDLGQNVTLNLLGCSGGGFPLLAGEAYLVVVGSDGDGGTTNDLVVATAGESEPQTSFYFDATDQTWYYTTSTPMVRMNLDPSLCEVGLNENEFISGVSLSPNPSAGEFSVAYNLNAASDVTIEVTDMTGKVIENVELENQEGGSHELSIDAATYAGGVYLVNIYTNGAVSTERFVKK